jgi:predicted nucleic acid-binding protein
VLDKEMRLYLDDDSSEKALVAILRKLEFDVQTSLEAALYGSTDAVHLAHAIRSNRTVLTRNYDDFRDLHDLIATAHGKHSGILVVRYDNDTRRDFDPPGIVRAIRKLRASKLTVFNHHHVLNQWR